MPTVSAPAKKAPAAKKAAKAAPVAKAAKKAPSQKKATTQDVLYPEVEVNVCVGDEAISEDIAKRLMGWQELPDNSDAEYHLRDSEGKKIRCTNNMKNRQIYGSVVSTLCQDILRGRWKMNGENIIIGCLGSVLNGQHSLLALIQACAMYREDPEAYPYWFEQKKEPVIEKLIAFGIDESDDVVNTMDTCKPRSLADVFYRSEYFKDMTQAQKKNASKIADYSIRLLWNRVGLKADAYAPKQTHSESLAFLELHPTLLECIKHIHEENLEGGIGKLVSPGTAAGMMYLMAVSASAKEEYHASENPREELLDTSMYDKAEEFWVLISSASKVMEPLRQAIGQMIEESAGGSPPEKMALIVKAWNAWVDNEAITAKDLKLKYHTDEEGYKTLMECPVIGGIDIGNPSEKDDEDISPEEIQRRAAKVKEESLNEITDENKAAKKAAKKVLRSAKEVDKKTAVKTIEPKTFKEGEVLWVTDPDNGEKWSGTYLDHYSHQTGITVKLVVSKGYAGAGKTYDINIKHISR